MIRSIWAVGRNYGEHAKELGHEVPHSSTDEPMIFLKAGSAIVANGRPVRLPSWSEDVQHEVEIALRFGPSETDELVIDAFTVALDLTARDIQTKLKAKGHPWTLAKSFTDSCPLGDWVPTSRLAKDQLGFFTEFKTLEFELKVNGERRQHGFTREMIFSLRELCSYLRAHFPVQAGDVFLTGTPAGVARLAAGDIVEAEITGLTRASWPIQTS